MGIRFLCPNGHKLHVKAFLAGKRGICPRCSAKFNIPLESDPRLVNDPKPELEVEPKDPVADSSGQAEDQSHPPDLRIQSPKAPGVTQMPAIDVHNVSGETAESRSQETPDDVTVAQGATSLAAESPVPSEGDPITEAPHAVWYVRPPSGGQYGPASGDIMRTWITEGRVTLDSLVWREGWPDWKKAGALFPGLLAANQVAIEPVVPQIVTEFNQGSSMALHRRRTSNMNTLSVVVMLIVACLVLFGALVYVVKYMN